MDGRWDLRVSAAGQQVRGGATKLKQLRRRGARRGREDRKKVRKREEWTMAFLTCAGGALSESWRRWPSCFPQADIFTLVLDRNPLATPLRARKITTSVLQKLPGVKRYYPKLLPLFPIALEQFRLDGYDLVISSESGPAKGIITPATTCHICYCRSPMRYLWDNVASIPRTCRPCVASVVYSECSLRAPVGFGHGLTCRPFRC